MTDVFSYDMTDVFSYALDYRLEYVCLSWHSSDVMTWFNHSGRLLDCIIECV